MPKVISILRMKQRQPPILLKFLSKIKYLKCLQNDYFDYSVFITIFIILNKISILHVAFSTMTDYRKAIDFSFCSPSLSL